MARFTPLETAVLEALVWDLRRTLPDLAGQIAASLPGRRRNTGVGLYTEIVVDRARPATLTGIDGRFGTVHAMVGGLPDPVAFQAEFRGGRLLFLHGDAYGQDTRAVNFATVRFDQVFTLDDRGESVAFTPTVRTPSAVAADMRRYPEPARPVFTAPAPAPVAADPAPRRQDSGPVASGLLVDAFNHVLPPEPGPAPTMSKDERISLIVGLWVVVAAAAAISVILFDVSPIFAGIVAVFVGRALQTPKGLAAVKRGMDAWRRARAERSV